MSDSDTAAVLMHLTQQIKALVAELKLIREQLLQPEETDGTEEPHGSPV